MCRRAEARSGDGISREGDRSFAAVKEGKHIGRDIWEAELTGGLGETTLAATKLSTREVLHSAGSLTQQVYGPGSCRALRAKGDDAPPFSQEDTELLLLQEGRGVRCQ